jgi:protein subunit release factor B
MVKDLRTGFETSNAAAVLDGELDPLLETYLRSHPYVADATGTEVA